MKKYKTMSLASAMFIFGTIGIFRKYIPLPSSVLAMARGWIGMLFLFCVLLIQGKKPSWREIQPNLLLLVLSGAFIGINWILLFESYQYTTVAVATLCYYMAPILVILASPFVLKEKLTAKKSLCVAVALLGMVFVSGVVGSGITGMKGINDIRKEIYDEKRQK